MAAVALAACGAGGTTSSSADDSPTQSWYEDYERGFNKTDLVVSFVDLPAAIAPGGRLDVAIGIENLGPNPTRGIAVLVPVPDGTTALPNPACTYPDGTVECGQQWLSQPGVAGQESVWEVVVSLEVAADYWAKHGDSLLVEASVENRAGDDSDPANNSVSAEVSVS